jgi:hypothetical protein
LLGAALVAWSWWARSRRADGSRARPAAARPAIPQKHSGGLPGVPHEPQTYQETLDEALAETFPASDPISPGQASRANTQTPSSRDPVDWRVERPS